MGFKESELIFDWNRLTPRSTFDGRVPETFDESLRDGIQSPSVIDPPIEKKKHLLTLMAKMNITCADLGLPGAGPRAVADTKELVAFIRDNKLKLQACAAARTVIRDLEPVATIQQETGVPVMAYAFLGTSPIRQYAEAWDLDRLLKTVEEAVTWAVKHQVEVAFVTEDTVRSRPETLDRLFRAAINHGAKRLVLCDTVGHATPDGVAALVTWTRALVRCMGVDVKLDWHGHNDRGFAVTNTLVAFETGVDRIHGTALGIGERVGNASMDQLLLNLKLLGSWPYELNALVEYCKLAGDIFGVGIPYNYPLAGRDAFRTATGVHAAAVIKAEQKGENWLADRIYSGVPASEFGKHQEIEIGPMSGLSNVRYWLKRHGVREEERLCQALLDRAKEHDRVLTEEELWAAIRAHDGKPAAAAAH
ncbi:MAG: 2-isopropylmalate synthase [Myxococcota bacterium]